MKVLLWLKCHWKIAALVVGTILGVLFLRRKPSKFIDDYRRLKEIHENEVDDVNNTRMMERREKAKADKRKEAAVKIVQEKYDDAQEKLTSKKKKEIRRIVSESGEDPRELAHRLAQATGYTVIMPEDDSPEKLG